MCMTEIHNGEREREMQRNITNERAAEARSYIFLIFSTDGEIENPHEALSSILDGEENGFKLEKVTVLKNPAYRPF